MTSTLSDAKELIGVILYKEKPRLQHFDALPFALLYVAWFSSAFPSLLSDDPFKVTVAKLGTLVLLAIHSLVYLFTIWSIRVKCAVRYRKVTHLPTATHVKVIPHDFVGTTEMVPLETSTVEGAPYISFSFRKLHFIWNAEDSVFRTLQYPTKLTFAEYRKSAGYGRESQVQAAIERWGSNTFEVPIPKFWDLMKDQLLAPFFCFQVFCVSLWALDEYWYYSLFTLFMLVTFESTVVNQRLRNLKDVRALQQPRQPLNVYRSGKWVKLPGEELVPGDVVSLCRPDDVNDVVVQADLLLLAGTCIVDESVLTGESTPQWKNPIGEATGDEVDASELAPTARLSVKRDKMHIVFGGTKLLQATGDKQAHIRTPDGGCLAVVLRTGFGTAQGSLMRTILYSTERVTANNLETFLFILFLLVWAVAASAYVLKHGLADPDRDRFKLILNCIMIITSVIPPELPMELTIAVNASLIALAKKRVFCTEPFRIPLAGKITTCCFDKTGTLTSDHMILEGIAGMSSNQGTSLDKELKQLPRPVARVLAGCQGLVMVNHNLTGDPVERAAIEAIGWNCRQDYVASPASSATNSSGSNRSTNEKESVHIMHRFHFSSVLKRMSTMVKAEGSISGTSWWVLTKGAPEVVRAHLGKVPPYYDSCYKVYAAQGARVLALAYKRLPDDTTASSLRHIPRDDAEANLEFAGFAVFQSPLKEDSEPALRMLRDAKHQLVMITGDAPLTACHVAKQVYIMTRPALILTNISSSSVTSAAGKATKSTTAVVTSSSSLVWRSIDESVEEPFSPDAQDAWNLAQTYDLCVAGDGLMKLQMMGAGPTYIPLIQVFARVTPEQKELVVKTLRAVGLHVLMCGDGTNDVGALKGAHVGVALLPPPEKIRQQQQQQANGGSQGQQQQSEAEPGPGAKMLAELRRQGKPVMPFHVRMAAMMDEMHETEGQLVKPGDASMASPFTAKKSSVMPCLDIIKQGRTTLITTVQMFKILGLLCLSTAYSLSVLYLDGIKLGDLQATLAGFLNAFMFFFISNAQPLEKLSKERPQPRIFSLYVFTSLLGQFVVYISLLMYLQHAAHEAMPEDERQQPDTDFKPNLLNTVCFLANFVIQTMTFHVNYVGWPFNTPLHQNKMFATSVRWSYILYIALVLDVVGGLNSWFSLVSIPSELRYRMLGLTFLAFNVAYGIEGLARKCFPAGQPPEKGGMTSYKATRRSKAA